jgi:autotransporter translocation and assembly factor TamB
VSLAAETSRAGRVRGAGRLDLGAAPLSWRTRLRFTELDPGAASPALVRAHASGTLEARGAGVGRTAPLAYRLALDPSEISGQPVASLAVTGQARRGVHRARVALRVPAGEARLRARVALAPPVRYRVGGRVTVDDLEAIASGVPGQARMRVAGRGQGVAADARRAELYVALEDARVRGVHVTQGHVGAWLEGDRLALGPVQLAGRGLWATGGGSLDLARREADAAIAVGLDEATGVARSARVDAHVRGPLDALAVAGTASAETIAWGTAHATRADARLELTGVGGRSPRGTLHATAAAVRAAGWAAGDVTADVDWQRSLDGDRGTIALTARDRAERTQELALRLEHTAAATRGEVTALALTPPAGPPWRLAGPARFAVADGVDLEGLRLVAGAQTLTLRGRVARAGTNTATLELASVRVAPLCELAGAPACQGQVSGRAELGGTAASPRLEATLAADDLRVEEIPYGRLDATLAYADASATLRADLDHPGAGMLHLEGRVPVDLAWAGPRRDLRDAPVALAARADALDLTFLRSLAPRELRATGGVLSLDLRLSGPWTALAADGTLRVDGGRLELAAAGLPYEDITLEARASGRSIEVVTLRAQGGDGTLEGSGQVDLGEARTLALAVRLNEFFALRRRAYEAVVSGTIDVGGTPGTPDVTGTVEVERFLLRPGNLPASGPSLERDPTIVIRGAVAPAAAPAPAADTAVTDPMRLAIDVRIARNAWIRRADANIELTGDLRVEKEPHEPIRVGGQIKLVRGWYVFQGRRFVIEDGRVTFTGAVPPDPALYVTASYETRDYRVIVQVGGTASKPTLTLASEPPLDQADILAVVLFGKPTNALGRSESAGLQQQALEISTGYVAPDLRESVMNSLGLDVFDVEIPQDDTTPGRVSVGRYVTGDVFVSLAQEFGAQQAEVMSLEYSLTRRISVRGSTSTRGDSAIDVFWRRRY